MKNPSKNNFSRKNNNNQYKKNSNTNFYSKINSNGAKSPEGIGYGLLRMGGTNLCLFALNGEFSSIILTYLIRKFSYCNYSVVYYLLL